MTNTEAIWREVVGDDLYEDEEDRRRHEELMALDDEENLSDEMSDQEFFDAEDAEDYNRRYGVNHKRAMTGRILRRRIINRGGTKSRGRRVLGGS